MSTSSTSSTSSINKQNDPQNPLYRWFAKWHEYKAQNVSTGIAQLEVRIKFILKLKDMITAWTKGKTIIAVTEKDIRMNNQLFYKAIAQPIPKKEIYENIEPLIPYLTPHGFFRSFIASCPIKNKYFRSMSNFANGHIFDIGAGSGYNAKNLLTYGSKNVYAFDHYASSLEWTSNEFYPIDKNPTPDAKKVLTIAKAKGAALWCWPINDYHHLDLWLASGGKKIITIGNSNSFDAIGVENVCPIFPPKKFSNPKFKCVNTVKLTRIETKNVASDSFMRFWTVTRQTYRQEAKTYFKDEQ